MVKSSSLRKRALSCLLTAALLLAMLGGVAAPFASAAGGITTAAGGITTAADGATSVTNLKVNALENPLGIDTTEPEFSWNMESNVIGQAQTSYRIQVSLNSTFTNLAWDSGEVSSNTSVGIFYDGDSLIPETNYWWRVTVIDFFGQEIVSDTAFFSTGVMEPNRDAPAWNGAKFIGSDVKPLDAATMRYWRISMSFEVVEGDNFSVILGADDFRLTDPFQNQFNTAGGENFVRVEIDGIGTDSANLNIYRVGYDSSDSVSTAGQPVDAYTQPLKTLSSAAFRNLFNAANASRVHTIDIACQDSSIATLNLDGTNFVTGYTVASGRVAAASNANISPYNTFSSVGGNRSFTANNAAPTYPNLASVGFQVNNVGDKVLVTNYRLRENVKNNSALVGGTGSVNNNRDFLNADTSVSYEIFDALDGVSVSGGVITVNPTAAGELGPKYTDPSYGAHPMLRSSFTTKDKAIADAKMYITAMGTYDMYINGRRMTEDSHNPGQSDYNHTIFYHTYDVKDLLIENADNAMGAYLAEDFWSGYDGPSEYRVQGDVEALFCKLAITYADGSTDIIVTDPANWKVWTDGPIRIGSNLMGERYDARYAEGLVDKGLPIEQVWATAGFDDSAWPKAVEMPIDKRNPGALSSGYALMNPELHARQDLPVHTIDTLTAVGVLNTHSVDGHTWTYDMGVNMVGVPEVTIPAGDLEEGDVVILRFGEVIYPGNTDSPNTHHPNGTSYESLYGPAGLYRPGVAGRILTETYRSALSADFYVASAYDETHDVTFSPTFTFHGYRYVQITIPHRTTALPANNVRGFFKSSLETLSGAYNAVTIGNSGDLINKLFLNTQRSTYANYFSVPTDCPQRNEREGWTGDTEVFARSAAFHGDNQTFLRTWMKSLRDVQYKGTATSPAGAVPDRVPRHVLTGVLGEAFTSPGIFWACAVVMVPYQLYSQFGDVKVIRENMGAIKLWLEAHASSYQVAGYPGLTSLHSGNADHVSIDTRSATAIVNNACMVYMLKLAAEMADVIGDPYADTLYARHAQAVDSWNRAFIDPNTGLARNATVNASGVSSFTVCDSQTAYSLAINFGIISDTMTIQSGDNAGKTYKEFAVTRLAQLAANPKLSGNSGPNGSGSTANCPPYTITTGFAGTPSILPALTKSGNNETSYKMLATTQYASWLYPITLGATSQWELWDAYERAFQFGGNSNMNSQNHYAPGAVVEWMYEYQLGVSPGSSPGYDHFILQPIAGGDYTALKGSVTSNYGVINSAWTALGNGDAETGEANTMTSYSCTVPANTTATLYLPADEAKLDGFYPIPGVTYLGMEERNGLDCAKFSLLSGSYGFEVTASGLVASHDAGYVVPDQLYDAVLAYIRPDEPIVAVNTPASYTVFLMNLKGAGVVTLSFTYDSRYLDITDATALNGFTVLDPLSLEYQGGQVWKGSVKLFCPGFTNVDGPMDILRISGMALDLIGDTAVTLTEITVTGDVDGFSGSMPSMIKTAEAMTSIIARPPVYSKYDLNKDGKIDDLDLAIVVYYYLANDLESDWEEVKFDIASAKDCDVALNGRVDLADMIEVIANYCDSYILYP